MSFDKQKYVGGTEYRWLITPMTRELIRLAVLVAGFVLLIVIYCLLAGCASTATMGRIDGFNAQWRGFDSIKGEPARYESVITVWVIVTDDLPKGTAATYSHPQGIIRIRGKMVQGKIILPEAVLGHEIMHALEYQAEGFVNPDKLTEMGF